MRCIDLVVFCVALLGCNVDLYAASVNHSGPSVDLYAKLPSTSQMVMATDGNTVAFRKFEGESDTLMIYSLKEKKLLRAVDVSSVQPDDMEFISPDQLLIRTTEYKRLPDFKDMHYISSAVVLDVTTGALEPMLRLGDKIYLGQTNVSRVIGISRDKRHLFMPAFVAQYDNRKITQSQGPTDKVGYAVMKVDIESPKVPSKVSKDDKDAEDYFIGKNDEVLVEVRYGEYSNRHEILVKQGGKWVHIYDQKHEVPALVPVGLTPDYKHLVVRTYGHNDRRQYLNMSLKDGEITDSGLNSDERDVESVLVDINRVVHGVQYAGFTPSYYFFDKALDQRVAAIREAFQGNTVNLVSWSDDWKKLLVFVQGSNYAGEYYAFDEKANATFLSDARPGVRNEDVHPLATVTISARDGLKIPTLLTIPKNKVADMENLPAVVMPHGGPRANDTIGFDWQAQALASQGYLVIQPQFRGSEGFGWSFIEAGYGEWGGKMLDDITDALDFTIAKGMVDPKRVCIVGSSYGGYAALASGANLPDKYRCVVSINGIGDMAGLLSSDRAAFGKYHAWIDELKRYVDTEDASRAKLKAISPIYRAEKFSAPVLLIHGRNDKRVPLAQAKDMASTLKKAGKRVLLLELENENHFLQQNASRLKTLDALVSFVNKYLQ